MADIIHRIGIKSPVANVYAAISTVEGIASWWTQQTSGISKVGGQIDFRFTSPDGKEIGHMVADVLHLDRNNVVHWQIKKGPKEWIGTDITFHLTEENGMTILLFGHKNWDETSAFMGHCSMKWATFLLSLKKFVETGKGAPSPNDLKIDDWN